MNTPYIHVDSATPLKTELLDDGTYIFPTSDEYRFLSAFNVSGRYILKCSKDLKEWETCIAAFINGKAIDPYKVIDIIKQAKEGEDEANSSGSDSRTTEG